MAKYYTQFEDLSTFTSFQNIPSTLHSLTNIPYYHNHHHHHREHHIPVLDFTHQSSSLSCNNSSTSDEAEDINHMSIINDRKQRRMISNRESARRSRMRKQRQLDELCTQLLRLRNEHHGLINKLNHFSEIHEQVVQENDRLKKETIELKHLLTEAQISTTCNNVSNHHQKDHGDHDQNLVLPSGTTQSSNRSTETSTSSGPFNPLN